ncbi:DUF4065 domain-containing protein [bacterium]|nr:MAG: DUF4065 domain-containing protein [bacterium]
MQYPALVVANEIIKLANSESIPISPMKLQKILYLANGLSYSQKGDKLILEKFEAWDYGPVIRSVYSTYKEFKGSNIKKPIDDFVHIEGYTFSHSSSITVNDSDLELIKEAWNNTKNLDAFTLSAWSHNKNSPWDKAFNARPKEVYISNDDMKDYFTAFFKTA